MQIIRPEYHPAQDAVYGGRSWHSALNTPTFAERDHFALAVQPFRAGGYEAVLRLVDLQDAADRAAIPRQYGTRLEAGDRSEDSIRASRLRAKTTVRKRIKDMGGNRLCTLTVRQTDDLGYMSPGEWARAFARFVRLLRRAGLMSDYVAILEPHKKGLDKLAHRVHTRTPEDVDTVSPAWDIPLHIHFVTRSEFKMPVNLMRKCWAVASGRDGNIDVQWLRARNDSDDAIDRVASYATKYITKGLAEFERFNKKRYWAAGEPLLPKMRSWLRSRTLSDAVTESLNRLGLSFDDLADLCKKRRIFFFPNGLGFWLNFRPTPNSSSPPF